VKDYARRLVNELEADDAVAQGVRSVSIVKRAKGYNRTLLRLSWDRTVVRDSASPLLTEEWDALATPKLWPVSEALLPTEGELANIIAELQSAALPRVMDFALTDKGALITSGDMPPVLKFAPPDKHWVVKRRAKYGWIGRCVIVRLDPKEKDDHSWIEEYLFGSSQRQDDSEPHGDEPQDNLRTYEKLQRKIYLSFLKLDNARWISGEPDAPVPLWGLENVKPHAYVMVHEGPRKAAAAIAAAANPDHPWSDELALYTHVAWTTGAHRADEADWQELNKLRPAQVIVAADNDDAGRAAVPAIAQALKGPVFLLQFDDRWPQGFDLADPFPGTMFTEYGQRRRYTGPQMEELLVPATWATKDTGHKTRNGYAIFELRPEFATRWRYVQTAAAFVNLDNVARLFKPEDLNRALAPFSHKGANTEKLLSQSFFGMVVGLTYAPDAPRGVTTVEGVGPAINQYRPSLIRPREGNVAPFTNFLTRLFPVDDECHQVKRWIATLIAHPDIMMKYGVLLYSKQFGVGKNTLTDAVLAPLVGRHNCSWPNEAMILNTEFNGWIVNRRLVVVSEIYSGHGMKMYNRLKPYITEKDIMARLMFMDPYPVQNWAQFMLLTNYPKALILADETERRWLVPTVTEEKMTLEDAINFRGWLRTGGWEAVAAWAETWDDYVPEGEEAPLTGRKKALVEEQLSEPLKEAQDLAEALGELRDRIFNEPKPAALACRDVWGYLILAHRIIQDDKTKLRRVMEAACPGGRWTLKHERVRVGDIPDYVLMNEALLKAIDAQQGETWVQLPARERNKVRNDFIRNKIIHPKDLEAF
jgi:hypothetical protein